MTTVKETTTLRPMQPATAHTGFLGNISIPQKFILTSLLLGAPLLIMGGILSNNYLQAANQAQIQALATAPYSNLEPLQLALRTMRGYSAKEVPRDALDNATKQAAELVESVKKTNIPEALTLANNVQAKTNALVQSIRDNKISANDILTQTGDVLYTDMQSLFATLADKGQLAASPTSQGRKLARMSSETLPILLPQIGGAYGGLIVELGDITSKQKGVLTDVQKADVRNLLDRGSSLINQVDAQMQDLTQTSPELKSALQPLYTDALSATRNAFKVASDGSASGKVTVSSSQLIAVSDAYLASQYKAFAATVQRMNETFAAQQSQARAKLLALLAALGALTLLLLFLLRNIIAAVTRPLNQLTNASQRLAQGNFDIQVPVTTRDEIGTLAKSFNTAASQLKENAQREMLEREEALRLQDNIGEFLDVTMDIAEGDLTKRGKVTDDVLGNVVDSINLMTEELGSVLKDVRNASSSVTGGSRAMLSTTEQINQGTQLTASEAERVTQQMQSLAAAIRNMAQNAQTSAETARQALQASQQGQQAVSSTLSGMQSIRMASQNVTAQIQGLSTRSEQIQEIVDSISHIASQTNLLALHASIEAAGAGESGQRFTVVAQEVSQLADLAAQESQRITSLVRTVQNEIQGALQTVSESNREVEQGYRVAGSAGERLREIGTLSERSAQLAEQISDASQQQVRGIEQMGQAVAQINSIAQQSAHSVEEGRAAAEQLQQLAGQLSSTLTRFKLPS